MADITHGTIYNHNREIGQSSDNHAFLRVTEIFMGSSIQPPQNSLEKKCWKVAGFQPQLKTTGVTQITVKQPPDLVKTNMILTLIPMYLYRGWIVFVVLLIYCKYKRD